MAIETSSGSTRERWVKALLPAAIIVMVYTTFINTGTNRRLAELRDDLARQREIAINNGLIQSLRVRRASLIRQREQLEEQIDLSRSGQRDLASTFSAELATDRMARVNQLCQRLSIGLLNQQSVNRLEVSPLRQDALEMLKQINPDGGRYQRLELVGEYSDMVRLLQQLPEAIEGLIPLGIELVDQGNNVPTETRLSPGQRIWRVFVLM